MLHKTYVMLVTLTLWCSQALAQRPVYLDRWVYVASTLEDDHAVATIHDIARTAAEHGLNGIVLDAGLDKIDLQPASYLRRLEEVKRICSQDALEIIPCIFSVGYGDSVLAHNSNLARVSDLGVAVRGESILALAIDRANNIIYGLTSPNAHFFTYVIHTGRFKDLGVVATKVPPGEKFEAQKMFSRMLAVDARGVVYASGENGFLYRFMNETQGLEKLPLQIPAIPGREPWARVDTFLTDASGLIFGGTSDGYLFRFDPEKLTVCNLGKPLLQYRITGLVRGANGRIYGIGGDEDEMARMFSYNPENASYEILGFVDVNRRPYYTWQAHVIKAMAVGLDGTIYIGESERISRLYLFYPW